jgi:hypothetical protein
MFNKMLNYPYAGPYSWLVPITVILIVSIIMIATYLYQTRRRR